MSPAARSRRARSYAGAAAAYQAGRPGYPLEALRWCLPSAARRVLDLGAGTGKLTGSLLQLEGGLEIVAVEPLPGLRSAIPRPAWPLAGLAEEIPLREGSVDAVLVGQAWHWFDPRRALAEVTRVLRPGGTFAALWNLLDDTVPWVAAVADACRTEDRVSVQLSDPAPPYRRRRGLTVPDHLTVRHAQPLELDGLLANVSSRSSVLVLPEAERAAVLARVRAVAPPGRFALPYVCLAWRGNRTGAPAARRPRRGAPGGGLAMMAAPQ
ncbi:MAG: class I SAM-dependent methyltransferase [Candidatus Dormibacteraceae bacterium]